MRREDFEIVRLACLPPRTPQRAPSPWPGARSTMGVSRWHGPAGDAFRAGWPAANRPTAMSPLRRAPAIEPPSAWSARRDAPSRALPVARRGRPRYRAASSRRHPSATTTGHREMHADGEILVRVVRRVKLAWSRVAYQMMRQSTRRGRIISLYFKELLWRAEREGAALVKWQVAQERQVDARTPPSVRSPRIAHACPCRRASIERAPCWR